VTGDVDVWETVWDRLNAFLSELAADLLESNPRIWWQAGHHDNPAFPFRAWASFNASGDAGEEDVVLSLGYRLARPAIEVTGDIADGAGLVLAEQPERSIALATDIAALRDVILASELDFERFVDAHRALLFDRLGAPHAIAD
jgi:hypothetical protein